MGKLSTVFREALDGGVVGEVIALLDAFERREPNRPAGSGFEFSVWGRGRCKATWKREFKLPWREAGPPNHLDDKVDSDQ